MFGRAKLKAEIVRLTYRVADLEERLCPCEDHDWAKIASETVEKGALQNNMNEKKTSSNPKKGLPTRLFAVR